MAKTFRLFGSVMKSKWPIILRDIPVVVLLPLYKPICALSATLLFPFLCFIKRLGAGTIFPYADTVVWLNTAFNFSFTVEQKTIPYDWVLVLLIFFLLNKFLIWLAKRLTIEKFEHQGEVFTIKEIGASTSSFFGFYLAFYFVAFGLPIDSLGVDVVCYLLLLALVYFSNDFYFNPSLLIDNYRFYKVKTTQDVELCLISKIEYRTAEAVNQRLQPTKGKEENKSENKKKQQQEEKNKVEGQPNSQFYRVADFTIWEIEK